jgi:predicted nucleic acid-binding protein
MSGVWVEASVIKVGDAVLTKEEIWNEVTAVSSTLKEATVYNFEVEGDHDYFVGSRGFLAHNALCSIDTSSLIDALERGMEVQVDAAIGGDTPFISAQAAAEIGIHGDLSALDQWVTARGGVYAISPTSFADDAIAAAKAADKGKAFQPGDLQVASQAIRDNMRIVLRDVQFKNVLDAIGHVSTTYPFP